MVRLASVQLAVSTSVEDAAGQSNSYADCFKGVELKRTLTVIVVSCSRQEWSILITGTLRSPILGCIASLQRSIFPVSIR